MFFYFCAQVDSINNLLKGPVMTKACEETKHFYSDHNQPGIHLNYFCVHICVCLLLESSNTLKHSLGFMWTEFRQTEDWTVRCRSIIHKNIQEDPWNLPSSIKTLVESLQRFVDG